MYGFPLRDAFQIHLVIFSVCLTKRRHFLASSIALCHCPSMKKVQTKQCFGSLQFPYVWGRVNLYTVGTTAIICV